MGCPIDSSPEESDGACYTRAVNISEPARTNRAVLGEALTGAGFVNYPTEWWHWSYGERYWALVHDEAVTRYAPVVPR
jgi:D-alanyl-D-alanine dipeptidase